MIIVKLFRRIGESMIYLAEQRAKNYHRRGVQFWY